MTGLTDFPPLSDTIVLLEESLVVRHSVLPVDGPAVVGSARLVKLLYLVRSLELRSPLDRANTMRLPYPAIVKLTP